MKLPEKPPFNWEELLRKDSEHIFKLVQSKQKLEQLEAYNNEYYHWSDLLYRIKDEKERKYFWVIMKFWRSGRYDFISFGSLRLKYTSTSVINQKLNKFDKYLAGNLAVQTKNLGLEPRYIISSLMEEAIASSILEGAVTTRKLAKDMLRQKRRPKTKAEKMVVNGYETMQLIRNKKEEKLTPAFLLDLQTSITKGTLPKEEDVGKFRDNDDTYIVDDKTGTIHHRPPSYKTIERLINELCNFANDDTEFVHPIVKASILHFLIGYIHPFNDGNGRTARSVFYWYLLSRGYWLFEYMALSRRILRSHTNYYRAYLCSEYDEMDLTYFIKYIATCVEDSLEDLLEYLKRKQIEQHDAKLILDKLTDLNFRQASILEDMMKNNHKYYSVQEISQTYHVANQTARTDLLYLTKLGYLRIRQQGRAYLFICDENCESNLRSIIS